MKVKICCISSLDEAKMAIKAGATEIGLVGPMPSGPGIIEESLIAEIVKAIPKEINTFFLTSEVNVNNIILQHKKVKTNTIQIVDRLELGTYATLREALPDINIVQVIHVENNLSIIEAQNIAPHVDYILLDSGNQNKSVKELGGTGRTHNWDLSRKIVKSISTPVFLAGGLNAYNINEAIHKVNPYGVDLCSGVRTNFKLDEFKLNNFFSYF